MEKYIKKIKWGLRYIQECITPNYKHIFIGDCRIKHPQSNNKFTNAMNVTRNRGGGGVYLHSRSYYDGKDVKRLGSILKDFNATLTQHYGLSN